MHDSFPAALQVSKKGYNAFALIYRSGGQEAACEDLARAVTFIFDHADELHVDISDYSLWGGSAGARMAAVIGSDGTASYGGKDLPRAAAVITQYTGYSRVSRNDPPTYACVGTDDGIVDYRTMQDRIDRIRAQGTDAEIEVFDGLPHGFGLGTGTAAKGWLGHAVSFWEAHMKTKPASSQGFSKNVRNIPKELSYIPDSYKTTAGHAAYSAFCSQIESMRVQESFRYADNEIEGNLTMRVREGYAHDAAASSEYTYNGLLWFWNP